MRKRHPVVVDVPERGQGSRRQAKDPIRQEAVFWLGVVIDIVLRGAVLLRQRTLPFLARWARGAGQVAVAAWSWASPRARAGGRRFALWSAATASAAWSWLGIMAPPFRRAACHGGRAAACRVLVGAGVAEVIARRGAVAAWPHLRRWMGRGSIAGLVLTAAAAVGASATSPALHLAAGMVDNDFGGPDGGLPTLEEPSTVVATDGTVLATLDGDVDRQVVPLSEVPNHVQDLVVVAEDRSFWTHEGYDGKALARSLLANVRAQEVVQGGSTISQQLAKLNFTDRERTWWRKAKEIVLAVALDEQFTKDQLLERYLNQVYFGSGAHGVAAAADTYFDVATRDLTLAQGALLAAVIPAPTSLDPHINPSGARARRDLILGAAQEAGLVSPADARAAQAEPLGLAPPPHPEPPDPLVATITRELLAEPALGSDVEERQAQLLTGGLRIETTIDPRLQEIATDVVADHLPNETPTAAVAAVDPASGAVLALFGGTNQSFDLAAQGRRQPGSAFKPLVAAAALRSGISPERELEGDGPLELPDPGGTGTWEVHNAGRADHGEVDMEEAMVESVNTAFAELTLTIGIDPIVDVLGEAGIDVEAALGPPGEHSPAMGLGGIRHGVTPLEMAAAYGSFANAGGHHPPHIVARITDGSGEALPLQREPMSQVLSPRLNADVLSMLQTTVEEGTGSQAQLDGRAPAGKTGTTQDNADAWFVGTLPDLAAAVWVGDPAQRRPLPGITGANTAAPIWQDFMRRAVAKHPATPFPTSARP